MGALLTTSRAVMPGIDGRLPHATSSFVWQDWTADIGYSNGFTFVAGMLNGAYAVGTPDSTRCVKTSISNESFLLTHTVILPKRYQIPRETSLSQSCCKWS